LKILILVLVMFGFANAYAADAPDVPTAKPSARPAPGNDTSSLLKQAQKLFYKNDHEGALSYLKKYFEKIGKSKAEKTKTKLRFLAISTIGRIYLEFKRDPEAAIEWFKKQENATDMTEAERDIVSGWIAAAQDWKQLGKFPNDTSSETELFENGKRFYEAGLKKQKSVLDQHGAADFSIAASYLVPFLAHYKDSPKNVEALYMMGDLRRRLWIDNQFWSENAYLTETIRRAPGTALAQKAYQALQEDVHFGYSGSSGDSTPKSWIDLLATLKKMAYDKDAQPQSTPKPIN
jgi:hypothetical protein